jgi:hypothetical protein
MVSGWAAVGTVLSVVVWAKIGVTGASAAMAQAASKRESDDTANSRSEKGAPIARDALL